MLFKRKPEPVRRELLKIDGRLLEVKVRLNPRARRMIVKVNPATGEVTVTAPSRRGLAHALDFARGEQAWIAGQLAKVPSAERTSTPRSSINASPTSRRSGRSL